MQSISVPAKAHLGDASFLQIGTTAGVSGRNTRPDERWGLHTEMRHHTRRSGSCVQEERDTEEWELVCLSDNASQALHLQNFVTVQRYEVGPALGKLTIRKVCRKLSVLTPLVDDDKERQVVSTFGSNNKILYGSIQRKFT